MPERRARIKIITNTEKDRSEVNPVRGVILLSDSKVISAHGSILHQINQDNIELRGKTFEQLMRIVGLQDDYNFDTLFNENTYLEMEFFTGKRVLKMSMDGYLSKIDNLPLQILIFTETEQSYLRDRELNYYLEFERVITSISQDFINCRYDEIDELIDQALTEVGIISGVDRVYLFQILDDQTMSNTHEWTNSDITPYKDELQKLSRKHYEWLDRKLSANQSIILNSIHDLPPTAQYEKNEFQREGIQSILLIPLHYGDEYIGFVGYDQVKYQREWQNDIVTILSVVGEIIVHSLQRFKIEETIRTNERNYRLLLENSRDGIYRTSFEGKILEANSAFFNILGYERNEMGDIYVPDLYVNPQDRADLKHLITRDKVINNLEVDLKTKSGEVITALISIELVETPGGNHQMYGVLKDITNLKKTTNALIESEKLNSLGILAGAIAHDFNNLLTSITAYSSMMLEKSPKNEIYELTKKISLSAEKASELSNKLLAYSGQKTIITEVLDLREEVEKNRDFIGIATPTSSIIKYKLNHSGNVEIDRVQFAQVLMNIVTNAVEAVEIDTGLIEIETGQMSNETISTIDFDLLQYQNFNEESYGYVKILDNGYGIEARKLSNIFEPFYTTKPGGTGLGLSTTIGIMKSHNGLIGIQTQINMGTTFWLFFPNSKQKKAKTVTQETGKIDIKDGRILLVDDDPNILEVLEMMMKYLNIDCQSVTSGEQAIHVLEKDAGFDMVIMDQSMPGLTGMNTIDVLRSREITLPVIISSGYSEEIIQLKNEVDKDITFLQKPYTVDTLKVAISKFLNE